MEIKDFTSHYHLVYEKKIPSRGIVKIDINVFAPRDEISSAFNEVVKIIKEDILSRPDD